MSKFLSPLSEGTDITFERHHWKDGYIVGRVHGFGNIRHFHPSRQDGSGFRMLVSAVTYMRVTPKANETLHELQYSKTEK